MDIDDVETDTITTAATELDQLAEMLSGESEITAEKLVIDTEAGNRLVIDSSAGCSQITIQNNP